MIPLPMKPGEMPQAPSREQVEEQSVRWAYLARQAMQRNDTKVAEQLGSVLQTALEGYYKMYGPEAGDQLRRAMAAAGVRADHELASRLRDDRRRVFFFLAVVAAALVLAICGKGRCAAGGDDAPGAEPPTAAAPTAKPKPPKGSKKPPAAPATDTSKGGITCSPGQWSSYEPTPVATICVY